MALSFGLRWVPQLVKKISTISLPEESDGHAAHPS